MGEHVAGVDSEQVEFVAYVSPERIVTDLGEHRCVMSEASRGYGHIGRGAADRLGERLWIDEPGAGLVGVEIDTDSADREELERAGGC